MTQMLVNSPSTTGLLNNLELAFISGFLTLVVGAAFLIVAVELMLTLVKAYLTKYRSNYGAIATRKGVDNVSAMLVAAKTIEKAVPYEQLVATDFMPPEAGAPTR